MKRTLLIVTLLLMFIFSGSSAVLIAFAEIAPIHAEGQLFTFQSNVEHMLLSLYPDTTSKAWYELKILDKRVNDLESAEGLTEETQRINAVWMELDHVLKQFQVLNTVEDQNLRIRFEKILTKIQREMENLSYLADQNPTEYSQALEKISRLKNLVMDSANPLTELYTLSLAPQGVSVKVGSLKPTIPISTAEIEPHKVPFLPGSA